MLSTRNTIAALLFAFSGTIAMAQGGAGSISGTVTDPTGAVIPQANVNIVNPVSGLNRTATTDATGHFVFTNVPQSSYHVTVSAKGFATVSNDVSVQSSVPAVLNEQLQIGTAVEQVTVEGEDLLDKSPINHTDLDRELFNHVPLETPSSTLSSLVTLSTPGVASDSNGLFHGLGDHASNSFSFDGQPITDQQSKVFSNQIPSNAVQTLEVISGAPPAEYGDKTSLVINVTTRSGLGSTDPTGSLSTSFGTFGTSTASLDFSYGTATAGNFFEIDGLQTGRFLDPPEFKVMHAKGNEENVFDRIDKQFTPHDSAHLNLTYSRSWFQTPNSYEQYNVSNVISGGTSPDPVFGNVGNSDQRSNIETYNIAPTYTRTIGASSVFNFGPYVRKDDYNYYPSDNALADYFSNQQQSISQERTLLNAGVHSDYSLVLGNNTIKVGGVYEQTVLREHDLLGIVDPTFNSPCMDASGNPLPGFSNPGQCAAYGYVTNPGFNPVLGPYDLTRNGSHYGYYGHTDVKELAMYVEDQIKAGNWNFNLGIRGDIYNGLATASQAEPRLGIAYSIPKPGTVLRVSYARTLETPFNENLVLSSQGCGNAVLAPLLACSPGVGTTLEPGFRNEFHAGLQQGFGKNLVISGDYIWKYTHNAFDFSVLGNTPITFPIDWHNSKIPGFDFRADVPNFHNITAFVVMSSVAARFFPPQVAGAGATVGQSGGPFRIDHDEKYNQTTHLQYQFPGGKRMPNMGFNWRFDSGLVAGNAPCYGLTSVDPNTPCAISSTTLNGQPAIKLVNSVGAPLSADQEFQGGFMCNGQRATPTTPLPSVCLANQFSSTLINIPAPNTGDNDHNPQRIAPRNLFDLSLGDDKLFGGDRKNFGARVTVVNLANQYSLYNFLSTFSGTHYVTPRTFTGTLTYNF